MANKIIRQNNIALIVFALLVISILSRCGKVADLVAPEQSNKEQRNDTKEVYIYFRYSRAFVSVNGVGKEMGNVDAQSLSVLTIPQDARISIMKYSGKSVHVTVYSGNSRTEYKLSDWYIL